MAAGRLPGERLAPANAGKVSLGRLDAARVSELEFDVNASLLDHDAHELSRREGDAVGVRLPARDLARERLARLQGARRLAGLPEPTEE